MEPTLERVREELTEVYEQLLALPHDAYEQRAVLKERQNELRQLSAKLIEGEALYDRETLQAAYERLHAVRDHLLDKHLSHASTSIGDAGIEGEFTDAVNKAIDAGLGIDEIEARLKQIIAQMRSSG